MQVDNLNASQLKDIVRRLERLERGAPMNNAAIGRGGVEVYDGGVINVSNGNLVVNGTATISGVLNADGTVTLSGTVAISGPLTVSGATGITGPLTVSGDTDITGDLNVTGPTHLNGTTDVAGNTTVTGTFDVDGPMTTTGTLDVEGVTTLKNDVNVTTGKISAGNVTIDPNSNNGSVDFAGAGSVWAAPGILQVSSNAGPKLVVTPDLVSLQSGGIEVKVSSGVYLLGVPTTTEKPNLYQDPATKMLYRSTATF